MCCSKIVALLCVPLACHKWMCTHERADVQLCGRLRIIVNGWTSLTNINICTRQRHACLQQQQPAYTLIRTVDMSISSRRGRQLINVGLNRRGHVESFDCCGVLVSELLRLIQTRWTRGHVRSWELMLEQFRAREHVCRAHVQPLGTCVSTRHHSRRFYKWCSQKTQAYQV